MFGKQTDPEPEEYEETDDFVPDMPEKPIDSGDLINKVTDTTQVPDQVKGDFWHFVSKPLSHSFLDPKDEISNENVFWISSYFLMKSRNMQPSDYADLFQIYEQGKVRVKQSIGYRGVNLLQLLTKVFQVVEKPEQNGRQFKR